MTGPRLPLTRERILDAAVALIDESGPAALTMRRLAGTLGVEAMALYHHLPNKDALLDGVVEHLVTDLAAPPTAGRPAEAGTSPSPGPGVPGPDDDWRAVLRGRFLAARAVMLAHPWAPGLIAGRTRIPTALYAYYDAILAVLVEAGFSYALAHRALHALGSLPLGFVQEVFSPAAGDDTAAEASEADLAAMAAALPHLTAMMAAEVHAAEDPTLGWCDSSAEFAFTLDLVLDGLEGLRALEDQPRVRTASPERTGPASAASPLPPR